MNQKGTEQEKLKAGINKINSCAAQTGVWIWVIGPTLWNGGSQSWRLVLNDKSAVI